MTANTRRHTCADCPNVRLMAMMGGRLVFCNAQDNRPIVPHHMKSTDTEQSVTFWRVPLSCPLPDADVVKSEEKAPYSMWQVRTFEQLESQTLSDEETQALLEGSRG